MYKIAEYAERIASEDIETKEKYEIIKSLSHDFTVENDLARKIESELVGKFEKEDAKNIHIDIPEIELRYVQGNALKFEGKVNSSVSAAGFLRELMGLDQVPLYEQFIILYLNRGNDIIGYYKHSKGGVSGTVVDIRLILLAAVKSLASGLILCHNHPSGNLTPSEQDKVITKSLKSAAHFFDINVLDHLIITDQNYYSFADQGLLGIESNDLSGNYETKKEDEFDVVDEAKLKAFIKKAKKLKF